MVVWWLMNVERRQGWSRFCDPIRHGVGAQQHARLACAGLNDLPINQRSRLGERAGCA